MTSDRRYDVHRQNLPRSYKHNRVIGGYPCWTRAKPASHVPMFMVALSDDPLIKGVAARHELPITAVLAQSNRSLRLGLHSYASRMAGAEAHGPLVV